MNSQELAESRRRITQAIDDAQAAVRLLFMEADKLEYHASILETAGGCTKWHPSSEIPSEDALYIVRTKTGSVFVSSPISGKWFDNIVEWIELPK